MRCRRHRRLSRRSVRWGKEWVGASGGGLPRHGILRASGAVVLQVEYHWELGGVKSIPARTSERSDFTAERKAEALRTHCLMVLITSRKNIFDVSVCLHSHVLLPHQLGRTDGPSEQCGWRDRSAAADPWYIIGSESTAPSQQSSSTHLQMQPPHVTLCTGLSGPTH